MRNILLVEPDIYYKYPPLGLMKIASAHNLAGDTVKFIRGKAKSVLNRSWDTIYISTMFTYNWAKTIDTINYYKNRSNGNIIVGGVLASLMPKELFSEIGISPIVGPLYQKLDGLKDALLAISDCEISKQYELYGIDSLPPDYGIFDREALPYQKILDETFLARSTRGCTRRCRFCGVPAIEPKYVDRIPLRPTITHIRKRWGDRLGLLLFDDNVLLSGEFDNIIGEIKSLGFVKGARLNGRLRYVDFNQGLDLRILSRKHIEKLAEIPIKPLRLALDSRDLIDVFKQKIRWLKDSGFKEISTYVLYNYHDSPYDLYFRLREICSLNTKYGVRIYSFPMKYIPCSSKDRKYVGPKWKRRLIRGVQCILNATHGIAPTNYRFFLKAFGKSYKEFRQIIQMPEYLIINRSKARIKADILIWKAIYMKLARREKMDFEKIISEGIKDRIERSKYTNVNKLLAYYRDEKRNY